MRPPASLGIVASPISPVAGAPAQTRRHLEHIATSGAAGRLRASLAHAHPHRSDDEIHDAVQDALLRAYSSCNATDEDAVWAWLRRTADRRLTDRARQLAREAPTPTDSNIILDAPALDDPQRELERGESNTQLVDLFHTVADSLSTRQRAVLALHARGHKRPAMATELRVSERVVKRQLETILARSRMLLAERCGGGCEHGGGDVWRLAFGLATGTQVTQAQTHLASCPACQAFQARLDWWREAAAAAIPLPASHEVDPALADRALSTLGDAAASLRQHLADTAGSLRAHAADATTQAKTHATSAYYRAADPTPLAGMRPGAAAAVIGSCLTVAGGGAYCLDQGVDPLRSLAGVIGQQDDTANDKPAAPKPDHEPADPAPAPVAAPAPTPPALTPPPSATPDPAPTPPAPTPTATPAPAPAPAPAPGDEFDPAGAATAAGAPQPAPAAPAPSSTPAPTPTPAPSGGGGEFGGP